MSRPAVILFSVGCAVITAVFLIVPVFRGTSFERMGVCLKADGDGGISVSLEGSGEYDMIRVITKKYGSAGFVIKDGGAEYRYKVGRLLGFDYWSAEPKFNLSR